MNIFSCFVLLLFLINYIYSDGSYCHHQHCSYATRLPKQWVNRFSNKVRGDYDDDGKAIKTNKDDKVYIWKFDKDRWFYKKSYNKSKWKKTDMKIFIA